MVELSCLSMLIGHQAIFAVLGKLLLIHFFFFRTSKHCRAWDGNYTTALQPTALTMTRFTAFSGAILLLLLASTNAFAAQKFPYTAQITEGEAIVFSSPGNERYETQKLKAGDKVEVYQINPDGWCAIRPPLGSFSWICGLYVEVGLDNIGIVTIDQLSSRIGSQFGDACKTVQVQLKKGERVILLERVETPTNAASPVWYKIVPPSGEFRWIHHNSIATGSKLAKPSPRSQGAIIQASYEEPFGDSDYETADYEVDYAGEAFDGALLELAESDPLEAPNMEGSVVPRRPFPNTANLQRPGGVDRALPPRSSQSTTNQNFSPIFNPPFATAPRGGMGQAVMQQPLDPYQRALAQLNQEVHATLSRPTEDWMFDAMIQKGKTLMERAPTEYDRTRAMQMVQVLEKTRNVRKSNAFRREQASNFSGGKMTQSVIRNQANPTTPAQTAQNRPQTLPQTLPDLGGMATIPTMSPAPNLASSFANPNANPNGNAMVSPANYSAAATTPNTSPFKATGRLGRFSQRPEGYPPYALVNEEGKIVSFVTPQPGVDLKPYINKHVGINGTSGVYIKDSQRAPHIGATAVFPIN